jgi:hypothetical protein
MFAQGIEELRRHQIMGRQRLTGDTGIAPYGLSPGQFHGNNRDTNSRSWLTPLLHQTVHLAHDACGKIAFAASCAHSCGNSLKDEVPPFTVPIDRNKLIAILEGRVAILAEIRVHSFTPLKRTP